ncbi:MAG: phosphatidate cytidylyltransferase [Acidobacteriota bacterium]
MKRFLSGLALGICLFLVIKFLPPFYTFLFALFWAVLSLTEFYRIAEKNGQSPNRWAGYLFTALILFSFYNPIIPKMAVIVSMVVAVPIIYLLSVRDFRQALGGISVTIFGVFTIGFLLGYEVAIRLIKGGGVQGDNLLIFLLIVIAWGDVGCYAVGRFIGKHRIFPRISPNKTLEGCVGGIAFNLMAAFGIKGFLFKELSHLSCLLLIILLGVFSQIGDLCESIYKRGSGVKDSSRFLPGHGGALDRVDSLLFSGPIFYYFYTLFLNR